MLLLIQIDLNGASDVGSLAAEAGGSLTGGHVHGSLGIVIVGHGAAYMRFKQVVVLLVFIDLWRGANEYFYFRCALDLSWRTAGSVERLIQLLGGWGFV